MEKYDDKFEALKAADLLKGKGVDARVIDMHTVKPLDEALVLKAAKETGAIVTTEEHNIIGGLGSAVADYLAGVYPVPVVRHGEGADPAAVVFDAVQSAAAKGVDIVICDTAGRLHTKHNLMAELAKIRRSVEKACPAASVETLLVLDAITGQNAISQAAQFIEAAGASGIILTKLDGTAKGGSVISVKQKLGLPVRFVGVGEGMDDLMEFSAEDFTDALFAEH